MKAVTYNSYGGPEVLNQSEVQTPQISEDEILIKVTATSYNPVDAMIRSGVFKSAMPVDFPFIPGSDVSGVVEKAGAKVNNFKQGDKVFGFLSMGRNGASAEYVATDTAGIALAPQSIPLADAAAVPLTALTAWQGLFEHADIKPGSRVLITAAAGGVGSFAAQFAKLKGAYVIGTASDESKPAVEAFGIDEIINYKTQKLEEVLTEKVDVIFNLTPYSSEIVNGMLDLLKPGGILVSALSPADPELAMAKGVRTVRMRVQRNSAQLEQIAKLIDDGKVKPLITAHAPLEELTEIHKKSAGGKTKGKVVITI